MAATTAGRRLTEAHRLQQTRLGLVTQAQLIAAWRLIDPEDLDATTEGWLRVAVPLVAAQRAASARLATAFYQALRRAENPRAAPFAVPEIPPTPVGRIATSLTVTGPVHVRLATAAGMALSLASDRGMTGSARAGQRLSLDAGRQTITTAAVADPEGRGFTRATSGNPCDYCEALAGIVFKTEDDSLFQAHDGCSCNLDPVLSDAAEKVAETIADERAAQAFDEQAAPPTADPVEQSRPPTFSDLTTEQMDAYRSSVEQVAAGERTTAEHWAFVREQAASVRT